MLMETKSSMTTARADTMLHDVPDILGYVPDDYVGTRRVHIYEAEDGSAFVLYLTDLEAWKLENYWYGDSVSDENYRRLND